MPSSNSKETIKYRNNCVLRRRNFKLTYFHVRNNEHHAVCLGCGQTFWWILSRAVNVFFTISVVNWKTTIAGYRYPPTLKDARPQTIPKVTWPEQSHVTCAENNRLSKACADSIADDRRAMHAGYIYMPFLYCFFVFRTNEPEENKYYNKHSTHNPKEIKKQTKETTKLLK